MGLAGHGENARCRVCDPALGPPSVEHGARRLSGFSGRVGDFGSLTDAAATFLFADIAGFTALTEAHGDEEAATLVADFCEAVKAELPTGASHVKTIGDALMLRIPDPGEAILLGLDITHGLMRGHGAPAVRVGLHHGSAIERDGDYFGATVNLAARVSGIATGGDVLVTAQTAALAPELEGVFYEARGRTVLRNVREPVELFAAVRKGRRPRETSQWIPSVGWWWTPTAPRAGSCTKAPPTSSARSRARASSLGTPNAT